MMKNQSMEDSVSANAVYKYMYNFPQLAAVEFNISAIINEFSLVFISVKMSCEKRRKWLFRDPKFKENFRKISR